MKSFFVLFSLLIAARFAGAGPAPALKPYYMMHFRMNQNPFHEIYRDSLANDLILFTDQKRKLPPILHVVRPPDKSLAVDTDILADEILASFDVSALTTSTLRVVDKPFRAGPKRDVPARLVQYDFPDGGDTHTVCMAFLRHGGWTHAVYLKGAKILMRDCGQQLTNLTYDRVLFDFKPWTGKADASISKGHEEPSR